MTFLHHIRSWLTRKPSVTVHTYRRKETDLQRIKRDRTEQLRREVASMKGST